jgi:hypothetical protein
MRLTEEKVRSLAGKITRMLEEHPKVTLKADASQIAMRVGAVYLADLRREEELDQEVKRLLEQHLRGVNRASIDYEELFRKAKAQVVKERKLVI